MRPHASRLPMSRRSAARRAAATPAPRAADDPDTATAPAHSDNSHSGWLAGLWQRLASAAVLIPIAIALVWFGGWIAFGGAVLTLILGAWELRAMLAHRSWYPLIYLSGAFGVVFLVAAMFPAQRATIFALGISGLVVVSFTAAMLTRPTIERTLIDLAFTIAIPFYIAWPMTLFLLLRGNTPGWGSHGFWWVLALFGMVWANDTAAFVTGHFLGRTRLASHISPAKTWEGFAGGLVFCVVAAFVLTLPLHIAWYQAVILGVLVAIAATLGDLAESLLKRGAGVKDSGTIVPGHGGILDRIDSLLFAVLVVFFFASFLHGVVH